MASIALLVTLGWAGQASAKVLAPHVYNGTYPNGSYMGADAVGGEAPFGLTLRGVAVDQTTGNVYVGAEGANFGQQPGLLYKLDSAGVSQPFSAISPNTVISGVPTNTYGETRVDNSGGPTQGRIFQWSEQTPVKGFLPSGEEMNSGNGFPNFPLTETGDNCGGDVAPNGNLWITHYSGGVQEFTPTGAVTTEGPTEGFLHAEGVCAVAIDSQENFYTAQYGSGIVNKYNSAGEPLGEVTKISGANSLAVDRSNDHLYVGWEAGVEEFDSAGVVIGFFGQPDAGHSYPGLNNGQGVAVNETTHTVYVTRRFPGAIDTFTTVAPITIPDAVTEAATGISATGATLHGNVDPDSAHGGTEIVSCEFKWGLDPKALSNSAPCDQPLPINANTDVSASISGLTAGSTYFFQLAAKNSGNGTLSTGAVRSFQPSGPPVVTEESVSEVHSDGATLAGTVDPQGGQTTWVFEYGPTEAYGTSVPALAEALPNNLGEQSFSQIVTGLQAGTVYHYRVAATNTAGTGYGEDHEFTTFPFFKVLKDACENAHVRQQVGAALLPDCRAYELVSAADTGGYDVESDLVSGQEPFGGYPQASDRVLYGMHSGAIPGPWNPTNRGIDPYLATRGSDGWVTTYAGIPADDPFAANPFSSDLDQASADLSKLAFGGPRICSPCFADGSTGIPVRDESGELIQGMAGPTNPDPGFESDGLIRKRLSADGTHLIFGSTSLFATGGHDETGDVSIYDRNLETGQTQVVSNESSGDPLDCLQGVGQCHSPANTAGIAELDVSNDGSRILVGQLVYTDAAGNEYFHLYMHMGSNAETVDLTPGTTTGALYDGMSEDGSIVYFSTRDPLLTTADQDTDSSIDIFRADLSPSGTNLTRISTGGSGAGNVDSCDPVSNTTNAHWNVISGGPADCSAVAIGGAGGVAAQSGAIYFLSPELLDGPANGTADAPNLYVAEPGSAPHYIVTLESDLTGSATANEYHPYLRNFGTAQNAQSVAVDASGGPSNGDVYVANNGSAHVVRKYDPAGNLITSWGDNGVLDGSPGGHFGTVSGLAVGSDGTLYIGTYELNNSGDELFEFNEDGTFKEAHYLEGAVQQVGIGVDDAGNVYYVGYYGSLERFNGSTSIELSGNTEGEYGEPIPKSGMAVDPVSGDVYLGIETESLARFSFDVAGKVIQKNGPPCERRCFPTASFGAAEVSQSSGLAVDRSNGDLYVDEGNRILRFNSSGKLQRGPETGIGRLINSNTVAVGGDGSVYANSKAPGGSNVAAFGPLAIAPEPNINNPAIVNGVNDANERHTADFQVTPSGDNAAFSAAIPITGYDNGGHPEIFRYDLPSDSIDCASCNPTRARATGDATMAANGLSLTDDGRIFFNSTEALAPRDLNHRNDAYEWSPKGKQPELISTGGSPFDSSLLSASADGKNAFFFTRDTLVPQDENGNLAKVYDAREDGGFAFLPDPVLCKASDECHGAGSAAPGPVPIGTIAGSGGNSKEDKKCRKGFRRRGERCVKKPKQRKQHRKRRGK
jgi:hypothetical protein